MYEAVFELETVTPLFMRGANQSRAEFRPASVKGVMRWWFRALAGSYFGNDIHGLKKAECKFLGCAGNLGTQRSPVTIETRPLLEKRDSIRRAVEGWDDPSIIVWSDYVDYFFFSVLKKKRNRITNKIDVMSRFEFFLPGSRFEVRLSSREESASKFAEAVFWLAVHLGGFGFRARRGAGSVRVVKAEGEHDLNFMPKTVEEIGETIDKIRSLSTPLLKNAVGGGGTISDYPRYPVLHSTYSGVFINPEWSTTLEDWIGAMNNFGMWYLGIKRGRKFVGGFRFLRNNADYNLSHQLENVRGVKRLISKYYEKRYYLGLPIRYANYGVTVEGLEKSHPDRYIDLKKVRNERVRRRASGYWMSLTEIGGRLYPVMTVFAYQLHPDYRGEFYFTKKRRFHGHLETAEGIIVLPNHGNREVVEYYRRNLMGNSTLSNSKVWPR